MNAKVKLLPNLRYFEQDDTDFYISGDEVKELPEKHLRSYSIKHFLFTGKLRVIEGELLFHMKYALVFIDKNHLYAKEFGNYFTKDLELDTIKFVAEEDVPEYIMVKLNNKTSAEIETQDKPTEVSDADTDKTSDESEDSENNEPEEKDLPNFNSMFLDDLKSFADENEIEYDEDIGVNDLRKLLAEKFQ